MDAPKSSPQERVVLGYLLIALVSLGFVAVSSMPMEISGRQLPPHPALAVLAGLGVVAALAMTFTRAIADFGRRDGLKLVFSNLGAGILIITGAGAGLGFFTRAIFGPAALVVFPLLWAGGVYGTLWFSKRP